jgi:hypothetical protein
MSDPQDRAFARAFAIERIVLRDYLDDVDVADLALDELQKDSNRTDEAIAKVVAMRMRQQ